MDCMQDQIVAKNRRIFLILFTGMGFIALSELMLPAQSGNPPTVRVEAREVLVPVSVVNKDKVRLDYLKPKVFHIFEDGVEQPVKSIQVVTGNIWNVHDSVWPESYHIEYSWTPKGIWSGPDLQSGNVGYFPGWSDFGGNLLVAPGYPYYTYISPKNTPYIRNRFYVLSYSPMPSAEGSCHRINVTVDQKNLKVFTRHDYCNVQHSPSDPLKGTMEGEKLETYAASKQDGNLLIRAQASSTFTNSGSNIINVAVDLPWKSIKEDSRDCPHCVNVRILGTVYRQDGTLVTRFSDESVLSNGLTDVICTPNHYFCDYKKQFLSSRYLTQIDVPPGSYNLQIVVSDGKNFGRANLPFEVDGYGPKSIAVSGVILCKRFAPMNSTWSSIKDYKQFSSWNKGDRPDIIDRSKMPIDEMSSAPEYHPLVSKGAGLTPNGDSVFYRRKLHLSDRMFSYFEVYEPTLSSGQTKVQYEMRVIDAKTDRTIVDTGLRSADSFVNPGKLIIPIAEEIAIDKLPVGVYRVEVQASDSTGKQTPWRSASFTVE